jgi:tetratricopeptide (TPR) repeat protein
VALLAAFAGADAAAGWDARVADQPYAAGQESADSTPVVPDPKTDKLPPDVREALARARSTVLRSPEAAFAWGEFGKACLAHELNRCAETCYRRARELAPRNFSYALQLARTLNKRDPRSPEAFELFRRAVQLRPGNVAAHWYLGKALERQGKHAEALTAFQRTTELDPQFAMGYRSTGEVLLAMDRVNQAIESLERSAMLSSRDGGVFAALAQAHRRAGNTERAGHMARLARDLEHVDDLGADSTRMRPPDPDDLAAEYGIAKTRVGSGQYEQALPGLRKYARFTPNDPDVYVYMATCHRALDQLDDAEANAKRALELKSDSVSARLELAAVCIKREKLREGMEHVEHAKRFAPGNAKIDEWIADVLIQHGYVKQAIVAYERAATLGAVGPDGHWKWGVALAEEGDLDAAIAHFADATEAAPDFAHAYYSWGMALELLGRPAEAIGHYRTAVELDPKTPSGSPALVDLTRRGSAGAPSSARPLSARSSGRFLGVGRFRTIDHCRTRCDPDMQVGRNSDVFGSVCAARAAQST